METFVTSDTHYWHKKILTYQAETRPWTDIREHNQGLIDRHNSIVGPNDEYWHLGDFGFCNAKQTIDILRQLNGKIHFIYGNHDKQMHDQSVRDLCAWQGYYHELKGYTKSPIPMFHYPIHSWNRMQYGSFHFYGHTHGQVPFLYHGLAMDVGVDTNDCYPYNVGELVAKLQNVVDTLGEDTAIVDSRGRKNKR